jgi:mono/diheme cytochrome c family protein
LGHEGWFNKEEDHLKAKSSLMAAGILLGTLAGPATVLADMVYDAHGPVVGENENIRSLYKLRCGVCHGANGQGSANDYPRLAPPLKGNPFITNAPAVAIIAVIRKGREGPQRLYHESYPNMPAFGAESVPDADALVRFLKTDLQK